MLAGIALCACGQSNGSQAVNEQVSNQVRVSEAYAQEAPIGSAYMDSGRVITLWLRVDETLKGKPIMGDGELVYRPGDDKYDYVLKHLGPMQPCESAPVYPFPDH